MKGHASTQSACQIATLRLDAEIRQKLIAYSAKIDGKSRAVF
jgi:hypothetical protein